MVIITGKNNGGDSTTTTTTTNESCQSWRQKWWNHIGTNQNWMKTKMFNQWLWLLFHRNESWMDIIIISIKSHENMDQNQFLSQYKFSESFSTIIKLNINGKNLFTTNSIQYIDDLIIQVRMEKKIFFF